jgi:hypothetical protein
MSNFSGFASFVLAATVVSALSAETHCPGNVASVPVHLVNRYQIVVPVSINHSGPYNFILDTGTEITMINPSLARELHLSTHGPAEVVGAGLHESASLVQLDQIEAGSHALADQEVMVYDFDRLGSYDLRIRGILGEDFLGHFDLLIDNAGRLLCLDDSTSMRAAVNGPHIPLVTPAHTAGGAQLPRSLIVAAHLPSATRPVLLKLDSGTNGAFLYNTSQYMPRVMFRGGSLLGRSADGAQRTFSVLPPQDLEIGPMELLKEVFVTLAGAQKDSRTTAFDGLLPTSLFRRVFINHAEHFAILDPW